MQSNILRRYDSDHTIHSFNFPIYRLKLLKKSKKLCSVIVSYVTLLTCSPTTHRLLVRKGLLKKTTKVHGQHGGGALPDIFSIAPPSLREGEIVSFFLQGREVGLGSRIISIPCFTVVWSVEII